jgi:hypothetical protein
MEFEINQVGKRWFIVTGEKVQVEATYSITEDWRDNWKRKRKWTLTGKGAKRYKSELVTALNESLKPLSSPTQTL